MKKLINRLTTEKFIVIQDQLLFSGTAFVLTLFLARTLTKYEFGLFSGILLGVYLLLSISNALIIQPLQVNLFKAESPNKYLSASLFLNTILLLVFLLLIQIFFQFNFADDYHVYRTPVLVFTSGFLFHDFFRKTFLASGKSKQTLLIDVICSSSQFTLLILLSLFKQTSLYNVLFALGASYLLPIITSILMWHYYPVSKPEFLRHVKTTLKQAGWLLSVAILQWCSGNFFTMVSGIYIGLEALGAFRLVQSIFGVLNILLQTFENYVLPKAAKLYSKNIQDSKNYLKKITLQGAILFIPVLLLLAIFSKEVMLVSGGERYLEYDYVVKLMALLYCIIYMGYPIRMGIRLLIINRSFFVGYLLAFIFSALSFQYLLYYANLTGAIIGLAINQLIMLSYWQYTLKLKKFSIWK